MTRNCSGRPIGHANLSRQLSVLRRTVGGGGNGLPARGRSSCIGKVCRRFRGFLGNGGGGGDLARTRLSEFRQVLRVCIAPVGTMRIHFRGVGGHIRRRKVVRHNSNVTDSLSCV